MPRILPGKQESNYCAICSLGISRQRFVTRLPPPKLGTLDGPVFNSSLEHDQTDRGQITAIKINRPRIDVMRALVNYASVYARLGVG